MIDAFAGDCKDDNVVEQARKLLDDNFNPCSVEQGQNVEIRNGAIDGLLEFGSKVSQNNNYGVTSEVPDYQNEEGAAQDFLDQYASDWKARTALVYADAEGKYGGETALLWNQDTCEEKALDNVDCSRAQETLTLNKSLFVWGSKKMETPKTKTLTVAFLTPTENNIKTDLVNAIGYAASPLVGWTNDNFRPITETDYKVTAVMKEDVKFMSPNTKASLALGGIGLLAILGVAYRRQLGIPL